jgi:outer membrane protein assembly factor BamA
VEISLNERVGKGDFAYWKYRLDFQRYFPLSADHRKVIAIRGLAETNQEKGGSGVPFFDMPMLGSWGTLRGFDNYRFRDKSAMALTVEYRYRIWRALDWGFFGEGGWNRFHKAAGVRLIMWPNPKFPIAADFGKSSEMWKLYINFSPRF